MLKLFDVHSFLPPQFRRNSQPGRRNGRFDGRDFKCGTHASTMPRRSGSVQMLFSTPAAVAGVHRIGIWLGLAARRGGGERVMAQSDFPPSAAAENNVDAPKAAFPPCL